MPGSLASVAPPLLTTLTVLGRFNIHMSHIFNNLPDFLHPWDAFFHHISHEYTDLNLNHQLLHHFQNLTWSIFLYWQHFLPMFLVLTLQHLTLQFLLNLLIQQPHLFTIYHPTYLIFFLMLLTETPLPIIIITPCLLSLLPLYLTARLNFSYLPNDCSVAFNPNVCSFSTERFFFPWLMVWYSVGLSPPLQSATIQIFFKKYL